MRLSFTFALFGLSMLGSGCALLEDASRNIVLGIKAPIEAHQEIARNRRWAEAAWMNACSSAGAGSSSCDYALGFKTGYAEYLFRGGDGEPPLVAPLQYRKLGYQTPQGYQAVQDWFAGYRHGAAVARESGARKWITGPSALPAEPNGAVGQDFHPIVSSRPLEFPPEPLPLPLPPMVPEPKTPKSTPEPVKSQFGVPGSETIQTSVLPTSAELLGIDELKTRITGIYAAPPTPGEPPPSKPEPSFEEQRAIESLKSRIMKIMAGPPQVPCEPASKGITGPSVLPPEPNGTLGQDLQPVVPARPATNPPEPAPIPRVQPESNRSKDVLEPVRSQFGVPASETFQITVPPPGAERLNADEVKARNMGIIILPTPSVPLPPVPEPAIEKQTTPDTVKAMITGIVAAPPAQAATEASPIPASVRARITGILVVPPPVEPVRARIMGIKIAPN